MMTGQPLLVASSSAGSPFRNPGADTVSAMPGRPVMNPSAAAAFTASSSWRMPMKRTPMPCAMRAKSVTGMPTTPYMFLTPLLMSVSAR